LADVALQANQIKDYDVVLQLQNKAQKTILARTDGASRRKPKPG
jgi:hypothetical protein